MSEAKSITAPSVQATSITTTRVAEPLLSTCVDERGKKADIKHDILTLIDNTIIANAAQLQALRQAITSGELPLPPAARSNRHTWKIAWVSGEGQEYDTFRYLIGTEEEIEKYAQKAEEESGSEVTYHPIDIEDAENETTYMGKYDVDAYRNCGGKSPTSLSATVSPSNKNK